MPSDQLLKCFTVTTLRLLDEKLLILRLVSSLCGPFQNSFHGHGCLDARKTKRLGDFLTIVVLGKSLFGPLP